jgi:cytidine deaminase
MSISSSSHQQLLPTVALGLSCGVGFFLAQETWKRKQWDWTTVTKITTKLRSADVLCWVLALQSGSRGWYPLAVWFALKDLAKQSENGPEKEGKEEEEEAPLSPPRKQDSETSQREIEIIDVAQNIGSEQLPPVLLQHVVSDVKSSSSHQAPQRQLEILVHNISHTDLVLSIDPQDGEDAHPDYCLCRPRFSAFDLYTRLILKALPNEPETVSFPRYERSEEDARHTIVTPRLSRQKLLPTGFVLPSEHSRLEVPDEELVNFRFRGRDIARVDPFRGDDAKKSSGMRLDYVFFPLLAALVPRWNQQIAQKYSAQTDVKKVLILVSGVGTPRNWTHSINGNSTEACSKLMEHFIKLLHPDITVVRVHSATNLFRYDENIQFAKRELRPRIDAYRDAHGRGQAYPDETKYPKDLIEVEFSPDWKRSFHVSLSYADGSPARIHAIQAALRPYRPHYFHFWQLKSFWHDTKIVDDDIEMHSFEEMETVPAMEASGVEDSDTQLVIQEMKAFRQEFLGLLEGRNDIKQFWLRKTKKPVLAVLLVKSPNSAKPILYRGTNMEVSMPTGSLCAERNVIGTALASNPGLKREDLKMVAVLAVPLPVESLPSEPRLDNTNLPRNMSFASYSSIVHEDQGNNEEEDWVMHSGEQQQRLDREVTERITNTTSRSRSGSRGESGMPPLMPLSSDPTPRSTPPGTPVRRIALYSNVRATTSESGSKPSMAAGRKQKRTVLVHSDMDLNPLLPCGACNEWLKKISESNPYFSVLTFTDADCAGVYVTPCQE